MSARYLIETSGRSADGSLLFEQRNGVIGDGPSHAVPNWTVLIDAATELVLVDCVDWPSSRITTNEDGSLFLRLQNNVGETLFRIDPATWSFRDQGINGPDRPLSELAAALEMERQPRSDPVYRRISPDGTIRIDLVAVEWSNSHWVYSPRVTDLMSGRAVLDLWNTDWDATVSYPGDRCVSLDFRRYHYGGALTIELDLANGLYKITHEPGSSAPLPSGPLTEAAKAMEASSRRVAALAAQGPGSRHVARSSPWAAWRLALLILLIALIFIAAATFLVVHLEPKSASEPRLLRSIPRPQLSTARPFEIAPKR